MSGVKLQVKEKLIIIGLLVILLLILILTSI